MKKRKKKRFRKFFVFILTISISFLICNKNNIYYSTYRFYKLSSRKIDRVFSAHHLYPIIQKGKYGYIEKNGETVIPLKFQKAYYFSEGLARVKLNGKWGYIDKTGRFVIQPVYDDAKDFSQGLAGVLKNGKWGYINNKGQTVIPLQFDAIGSFSEGLASVMLDGSWGYVDQSGQYVIPRQYDSADEYYEGLAVVSKNKKYGYINKSGDIVIPIRFLKALRFSQGLAGVFIGGKWGFINKEGEEVIPPQFDAIGCFSEGLASVMVDGIWGYIDQTGQYVIQPQYEEAGEFSEDLAVVKLGGESGFITDIGGFAITPEFYYATSFINRLARVKKDKNDDRYIDKRGNSIWDVSSDDIAKIKSIINKYMNAYEQEDWARLENVFDNSFFKLNLLQLKKDANLTWKLYDITYKIENVQILEKTYKDAEVSLSYRYVSFTPERANIRKYVTDKFNSFLYGKFMRKRNKDVNEFFEFFINFLIDLYTYILEDLVPQYHLGTTDTEMISLVKKNNEWKIKVIRK